MSINHFGFKKSPALYCTSLVVDRPKKEVSMTIGIGAFCERGSCIVLGSDTRASYDKRHRLGPNDWISKFYDLPHGCFGVIAGTLTQCHGVSAQIATEFANLKGGFDIDQAREAINKARFHEFCMIGGERLLATFGITLQEWWNLTKDARVYRGGKAIFRGIPLEVEIIVAGFQNRLQGEIAPGSTSAMLFRAISKNPIEPENNYTVIGSGANAARRAMDRRGQHSHRSWQRTAIDVIAAMQAAQKSEGRTVGNPNDLVILWEGKTKILPTKATFVGTLLKRTAKQNIPSADRFDEKTERLLESLLTDPVSSAS